MRRRTCSNGPGHQILAPIATNGTTTFTKATTATIPIQFRVCDSKGTSVSGTVVSSVTLQSSIIGGVTTTLNQAQRTAFAFVGGNLLNGAGTQGWQLVLNINSPTNLVAGTTYVYQIGLNDGTSISFQFTMKLRRAAAGYWPVAGSDEPEAALSILRPKCGLRISAAGSRSALPRSRPQGAST